MSLLSLLMTQTNWHSDFSSQASNIEYYNGQFNGPLNSQYDSQLQALQLEGFEQAGPLPPVGLWGHLFAYAKPFACSEPASATTIDSEVLSDSDAALKTEGKDGTKQQIAWTSAEDLAERLFPSQTTDAKQIHNHVDAALKTYKDEIENLHRESTRESTQ